MRETWGRFPASISPYPEGNAAMTDILKLFIVLAAGSFSGLAAAQGAVSVQPNAIIHSATPGGTITQQLRLDNPGEHGAVFSIRLPRLDAATVAALTPALE